jgi:hypothetical protein
LPKIAFGILFRLAAPTTGRKVAVRRRRTPQELLDHYGIRKHTGCIEWQGAVTNDGYGIIGWWEGEERRTTTAHRKAFELANGPVPDNLCVMHRCDNPACVNVDHLELGTQADNIADMVSKNRANFFGRRSRKAT